MATNRTTANADRMGTMPVNPLLLSMAVPMVLSMMVQALYNIVDSIFVARLSEDALTAVTLAFPLQNIMIAMGVGIGVGVSALMSRMLGQEDQDMADRYAMQGFVLDIIAIAAFLIIGLFFVTPYVASQVDPNMDNAAGIAADCTVYLRIVCMLSFGLFLATLCEKLLSGTGRTVHTMIAQMTGAVTNIILDPIMIFGLLGFPKMGVAGAALATVIGQILGGIVGLLLNLKINRDIHLKLSYLKPNFPMMSAILKISLPSILMQAIGSMLTYCLNIILMGFSKTAVAVYGAYFKLQSFVFMPIFGLNNGMVPIIAYNYGARNKERIHQTVRLAMAYAVGIMLLGLLACNLFPEQLLRIFDASDDMIAMGIPAFKTISLSFAFAGISIISSSTCQAFGFAMYSLIASIARQLVVLLPCIYIMSLTGVLSNIWWAWPMAEVMSLVVCLFFLKRVYKKTGMSLKNA